MDNSTDHPSYPNPTIVEALCEIHFDADGSEALRNYAGRFFEAIRADFPSMEPVAEIGIDVQVSPSGLGQHIGQTRHRLRFKHRDRPMFVQISPEVLTVNVLAPYPGWSALKSEILSVWRHAHAALGPSTTIRRIGLRYINRIGLERADQTPGEWLKATDFIPAAVLQSEPGFFSRVIVAKQGRTVVTLGDQRQLEGRSRAVILDIDRNEDLVIAAMTVEPDLAGVGDVLDHLHGDVWRIFAAASSERLQRSLEGGQ